MAPIATDCFGLLVIPLRRDATPAIEGGQSRERGRRSITFSDSTKPVYQAVLRPILRKPEIVRIERCLLRVHHNQHWTHCDLRLLLLLKAWCHCRTRAGPFLQTTGVRQKLREVRSWWFVKLEQAATDHSEANTTLTCDGPQPLPTPESHLIRPAELDLIRWGGGLRGCWVVGWCRCLRPGSLPH